MHTENIFRQEENKKTLFFIIFILKLFYYSRFIIFATLIIYLFLEILAYAVFYLYKWGPNVNVIDEEYNQMDCESTGESQEEICIDNKGRRVKESLKSKLSEKYLNHYEMSRSFSRLYDFIDSVINLDGINASDSLMLDANNDDKLTNNNGKDSKTNGNGETNNDNEDPFNPLDPENEDAEFNLIIMIMIISVLLIIIILTIVMLIKKDYFRRKSS